MKKKCLFLFDLLVFVLVWFGLWCFNISPGIGSCIAPPFLAVFTLAIGDSPDNPLELTYQLNIQSLNYVIESVD
jgi:hypothetical protein